MFSNVLAKINTAITGFGKPVTSATLLPLISADESNAIKQYALKKIQHTASNKELYATILGDLPSRKYGAGYDFEQHRQYQAGDDSRLINWRVYAKTEKLYVNVFHEDRQPATYVFINRSASMRFGTRKNLKVKQAARLANYHYYLASLQHYSVGGGVVEETINWYPESNTESARMHFLSAINDPCPPLFDEVNISTEQMLAFINEHCYDGSNVILISDFLDTDKNCRGLLYRSAEKYNFTAYHITDPIEQQLPPRGKFSIYAGKDQPVINVNCDDASIKRHYKTMMKEKFSALNALFKQCGVKLYTISTTDELFGR